eukprot:TRINITY_DN11196_c0_g2_i2.p6 TRINITY_DN11196_c0_g2~~TRINITY_DN11196_c0_g2_i2.p6  ORF type:complete len:104 (-),score=13.12 TRINITY_DN11196_c0_g2_i2:839-1150(-)
MVRMWLTVVTVSGYLYYWYRSAKMATPMALVTITSLLASTLSYMLSPILYNINRQLSYPMWASFGFGVLGLACGIAASLVTVYGENTGLVHVAFPVNHSRDKR